MAIPGDRCRSRESRPRDGCRRREARAQRSRMARSSSSKARFRASSPGAKQALDRRDWITASRQGLAGGLGELAGQAVRFGMLDVQRHQIDYSIYKNIYCLYSCPRRRHHDRVLRPLLNRPCRAQPPPVHHRQTVADTQQLRNVRTHKENRLAFGGQSADPFIDLDLAGDIDAAVGSSSKQDIAVVMQQPGELHFLLVAPG